MKVVGLAHYAIAQARGQAAKAGRVAQQALRIERLETELSLLREELRIKDARMAHVPPHRRPHYAPVERMAVLELRAMRGWSLAQTARRFLVTAATVSDWMRRADQPDRRPLVQLREPVNKFPEFIGYVVRRLKLLCPTMGKRKIVETLARAGLHLAVTTVGRMLQQPSPPAPSAPTAGSARSVTAKHPNHVWHADLTCAPIVSGFRVPWSPLALPQRWPFCWWIAVVVDQYSRRALGAATFYHQPDSVEIRAWLGRTIGQVGAAPKYIVCDRGTQFACRGFRRWAARRKIAVRYGAVSRHGSIAIVERLIRTLKENCRRWLLIPLRRQDFRRDVNLFVDWYNESRPHSALGGKTPSEVYFRRFPACRRPRYEPRADWPRGSPCAGPWALVRGRPGAQLELEVEFRAGRSHLPIVALKRVA